MRGLTLVVVLLIPAFIALGHDIYLFYENYLNPGIFSLDLLQKEFKFSALGFIWTSYDLESYKMAVGSMEPDDWSFIDYFLTFKAFFVALGFAGIFIVPLLLLALFGVGPFAGEGGGIIHGSSKDKPLKAHERGTKMKYKRK